MKSYQLNDHELKSTSRAAEAGLMNEITKCSLKIYGRKDRAKVSIQCYRNIKRILFLKRPCYLIVKYRENSVSDFLSSYNGFTLDRPLTQRFLNLDIIFP